MKKIIIIVISLMMMGCSIEEVEDKKDLYFVFATPLNDHEIWLRAKTGFDDACSELNINCDWLGPDSIDTDKMEEVIEIAISQKADAIITQGVISNEILDLAKNSNVPIMLVDSDVEGGERFGFSGKDFTEQASLYLEDIQSRMGTDIHLNIGIQVAEKDFKIAQHQIREIENVFQEHRGGYTIKVVTESKSDSVRAKNEWLNVLKETDINVAINFAGESAVSCSEVAYELGIRDQILIYGVDDMESTLELIKKGEIDGSVVTSFYGYGYNSTQWLYNHIVKGTLIKGTDANLKLLTYNNIEEYEGR